MSRSDLFIDVLINVSSVIKKNKIKVSDKRLKGICNIIVEAIEKNQKDDQKKIVEVHRLIYFDNSYVYYYFKSDILIKKNKVVFYDTNIKELDTNEFLDMYNKIKKHHDKSRI